MKNYADLPPSAFGFPMTDAPDLNKSGAPAGGGRVSVPSFSSFQGIFNTFSKSYRYYNGDEALRDSYTNSRAMRRDPVIYSALRSRQKPTILLSWHLDAFDNADPAQVEAAETTEKMIKALPNLQGLMLQLMEAIWYGRSAVQMAYEWTWDFGSKQLMAPREYFLVNGDKLVFKFSGQPGIRVHSSWGHDQVEDHTQVTDYGKAYFFTPSEQETLIIHKFEPCDEDFREPELAGAIHGVGLRGKLYWAWALKNDVQKLLFDWLEWFARGKTVYYYEAGNAAAYAEVQRQIVQYANEPFMLFPRTKDGSPNWVPVQRIEAGTASPQLLQTLATEYFDNLLTKAILDQTLTSDTGATGMGSGVAQLHQSSFDSVIKYDSNALAETLTQQFVKVLYRTNYPTMRPARWVFEIDRPNVGQMLEAAQVFYDMGGSLDEDDLREATGLPAPSGNGTVLSKINSTQPAAVGGMPEGVPVVNGSPDGGQPGDQGPTVTNPPEQQTPQG